MMRSPAPGCWVVDPDLRGARRRLGEPAGEALGVHAIGRGQHRCPCRHPLLGPPVMHVKRCQQSKARMMVLGVAPGEEDVAVAPPLELPDPSSGQGGGDGPALLGSQRELLIESL